MDYHWSFQTQLQSSTNWDMPTKDLLMVTRFSKNHERNAIAGRGTILRNAIVRNTQDFVDKSYKCLAKTLRSCDLFQELTFGESSLSTANFRSTDFSKI